MFALPTRPSGRRIEQSLARPVRWGLAHAMPRAAISRAAEHGDLHSRLVVAGETPEGDAADTRDATAEVLEEIRAQGPMVRSRFAYLSASQPVVREVLSSNDVRAGVEFGAQGPLAAVGRWAWRSAPIGPLTPPSLLVVDPPEHTRYRKLVTGVFSVKAVRQLQGRTETIAADLLDEMARQEAEGRSVDLVEEYCALLPVSVIAEILGVPPSDRDVVLRMGAAAAPSLDLGLTWGTFRSVEKALAEFEDWLDHHLDAVRRDPGDDLFSQLVAARDADGRALADHELKATAGLILAAGFETTVNLLGNGIVLLREHPEQLQRLDAEPDLWSNAIDEVLRYDPPVLLTGRTTARDTTLGGRDIPAGSVITALLAGANRDPEVFADPDRFDVARENARDHVSFSAGRHYCLGAALAKMEGEVGLRMIFDRFPHLALQPGARRRETRILRGYATLPVHLGTPAVAADDVRASA